MGESTKHSWLQADDDTVRQKLGAALRHAQSGGSPVEILGSPPAGQYRKAFLNITKTYHPNRFARRPDDIRKMANDVYILLKEAFEKAESGAKVLEREEAQRKEKKAKDVAKAKSEMKTARDPNAGSSQANLDPAVLAMRRAMRARRQSEVKMGLGGKTSGTGQRTAQVRAATDPKHVESDASKRADEEERFVRAVNQLRITDFISAASTFKELAIGRPSEKRFRMHMHYAQGKLRQSKGDIEEARAEYKRALGLDANFAEAHQAMESLPGGNKDKAKKLLKKFFKS